MKSGARRSRAALLSGLAPPLPSALSPQLERQIVIFRIQRLGKIIEPLFALRRSRTGGHLTGAEGFTALALAGQQDELPSVDLRGIASLPLTILPGAVLDASLHVDLVSFLAERSEERRVGKVLRT